MLTAAQCAIVAYVVNECEIVCPECAEETDDNGFRPAARPISQYELDCEQTERFQGEDLEDIFGEPGHTEDCAPALECEHCYTELVEAYHYGHYNSEGDDVS